MITEEQKSKLIDLIEEYNYSGDRLAIAEEGYGFTSVVSLRKFENKHKNAENALFEYVDSITEKVQQD